MSSPPPLLLSVSRAMPEAIRAVPDLSHCINSFLLPRTVDAAVYNDLPGVLRSFEAFLPWTFRAMDGAAARGRLDIVQTLLDTRTEGCSTQAFVGAAANGHVAVLRKLKWNYPELFDLRDCVTAAAEHGNVEVLEGLKPWPCNLNRAVCEAAARGHVHVLESFYRENRSRTFLSGDALEDIGVRGTCAAVEFLVRTCGERDIGQVLSAAARAGRTNVVQLILRSGQVEETRVVRALNEAERNGRYETLGLLLEQCPRRDPDNAAVPPGERVRKFEGLFSVLLRSAVGRGDVKMVGIHVKYCRLDAIESALEKAAKSGSRDMVKLLLDNCSARNESDSSFRYAVGQAAGKAISCGNREVAKLILGECDGSGAGRALRIAMKTNNVELAKASAEKSDNRHKRKALIQAAQGGQIEILDALMKYLDNSSILKALNQLPLDVSVVVLKKIMNKCALASYPQILADAAARGFLGLVKILLNEVDSQSIRWAVMSAASNGHTEVVTALLGKSDSESAGCALEAAAIKGQIDVVDQLRGHCDEASISSALESAEEMGHSEVVRLLTSKKPRRG